MAASAHAWLLEVSLSFARTAGAIEEMVDVEIGEVGGLAWTE